MAIFQGTDIATMLDDASDWNNLDEEVKEEEKHETNKDFNADVEENGGLDAYLNYIEEYQVFVVIIMNNLSVILFYVTTYMVFT